MLAMTSEMGISCANRGAGKTNEERQCKLKELSSALPCSKEGKEVLPQAWRAGQVTGCDCKVQHSHLPVHRVLAVRILCRAEARHSAVTLPAMPTPALADGIHMEKESLKGVPASQHCEKQV